LEVETEEEDTKGPYIFHSKVEKVIKEMRDNKATGNDDVPGDVLKLEKTGLNINTINNIRAYTSGEWPKDFTEFDNDCLKEAKSYKMQRKSHNQPHRTYSKDSSEDTWKKG
jgi:hypothetical protein